jgi:predicted nucleic acid binding AN1-type Zn finger protein
VPLIYIISIVLLDVFIFSKTTAEVFATLYVNYIKIRLQNTFNAFAVLLKQYLCNKPKIYFMKNYALALLIPSLSFVSSCNTKADEKKRSRKIAVVTVDTVKKKGNQYNRHY